MTKYTKAGILNSMLDYQLNELIIYCRALWKVVGFKDDYMLIQCVEGFIKDYLLWIEVEK